MKKFAMLFCLVFAMLAVSGMRPAYGQYIPPDSFKVSFDDGLAMHSEVESLKLEIVSLKEEIEQLREEQNATGLLNGKIVEALLDRIEKLEARPTLTFTPQEPAGKWTPFLINGTNSLYVTNPCSIVPVALSK